MRRIWIMLSCIHILYTVSAQTFTVLDFETDEPVDLVVLMSTSPEAFAVTNSDGQVDISAFRGADSIEIRKLGYLTEIKSFAELEAMAYVLKLFAASIQLEGVVVSATRWNQSSRDVPAKVVSVSQREATLQNPQNAADLLNVSGKVFIQKSQQGGGSPMIRGFATNRLLYSIDGVRMNTAIFRGGNLQNVINLDPFTTEHVEVLFGPGSVIYGSDAIGGVMSFRTLTPKLSLTEKTTVKGSALARYSTASQEKTGHLDVRIGWRKWAIVTSFSTWDFDHLRQGRHGPDDYLKDDYIQRQDDRDVVVAQEDPLLQIPSAYGQQNLMQKVRFKPNENWDLQYGFHYSETSPYGRYDRHNRRNNGTARYAEWNYGPQLWMMHHLNITNTGRTALYDVLALRLAVQRFEESRISRNLNAPTREVRAEGVDAYSVNLDLTKTIGLRHKLYYGVEFVQDDVTSEGTDENVFTGIRMDGPDRYPQATWRSMAVYLNDAFRVSDRVTVQAGMRYNQIFLEADFSGNQSFYPFSFSGVDLNNGSLTGTFGAVYRPDESLAISTNFGTAFRAPNVDDVGKVFDSEPGAVVVPNPDLEPEYAYNIDIGFVKVFGEHIKIDFAAYYTILENALVRRGFRINGQDSIVYDGVLSRVEAIRNAATANVYGVQAGLEIKLPAGLRLESDFNFQKGEEETDDGETSPSRHAAPWFGVSRISYRTDKLEMQVYAQYQGTQSHANLAVTEREKTEIYALDKNGNTYAPAWYTLNLKILYALSQKLKLTAGVENLTDQRYRPYSSGISGPGRNIMFSVRADF